MVHIYVSQFTVPLSTELPVLQNYLTDSIISKSKQFRRWQDSHCHLLGRLLLFWGLHEFRIPYSLNDVKYNNHGRPSLGGMFDFNISHTDNLVVCAISNEGTIGIDVELMKPIDRSDFESYFLSLEWTTIMQSDNLNLFYKYWTMKESAIKADGRGLSIPLSRVVIKNENNVLIEGTKWQTMTINTLPDYVCHIASERFRPKPEIEILSPVSLYTKITSIPL